MRIAGVRINRRRVVAAGLAAAGVVAAAVGTAQANTATGLALLAAAVATVLAGVALLLVLVGRQHRAVAAATAPPATRAPADAAATEIEQLRVAVRTLQQSLTDQLAALERDQRRMYTLELVHRAQRHRHEAEAPPRREREVEVSLIRDCGLFDPDFYQSQAGMRTADPVEHYVDVGAAMGLDPHPQFPTAAYLERHPEALTLWRTPLAHYLAARRDPAVRFDPPLVRGDRAGAPYEDDLKWEYLVRGMHEVPDTFVLYRIIGNDLPPRHRVGQGLDNLRFVLEHEPDLPGCRKRWVVNRIVDPAMERRVIALLEEYGAEYLHIPFDATAYRGVGWRFHDFELPGFTYRPEFGELTPADRQRALDVVYHDKNLYVMNNNGARNAALREGRGLAKWVLPWDGNCYLTRAAWDQITAAVTARPHLKYFTVPMARVVDNEVLLRPDPQVDPVEEPQLIFRRDAAEEFDENARYGRCPKVELLRRLGVDGPWEGWCRGRWDPPPGPLAAEAGQVGTAGWVARLYSGQRTLERDIGQRGWRRMEAVRDCIDRVDASLAAEHFDPQRPRLLDPKVLEEQRERWRAGDPDLDRVVGRLIAAADGHRGRRHESLAATAEAVAVLGLAGFLTRRSAYLAGCVQVVRTRFLARRGRLDPRRWHGHGLHYLPDLARFLEREAALTPTEVAVLRSWLAEHRAWLEDSAEAAVRRSALDQAGTWYDVTVAALDSYLDDLPALLVTLRRAHERVGQQFEPDGRQLTGLPEPATVDHQLANLQGWATLATLATHAGQDLWSYRTRDGRGLAGAIQAMTRDLDGVGQLRRPESLDTDRMQVIALAAADQVAAVGAGRRGNPYGLRQLYPASSGIRPFWVLGGDAAWVSPLAGQPK